MENQINNSVRLKKIIRILWILFIIPIIFLFVFFYFISQGYLGYMPSFEEMENPKNKLATEIISNDGIVLGTYFRENRTPIKYNEISQNLVNALIATEDARFYSHSGVDLRAIGRVILGTGKKGGGSTLSQQLAKMLFPREEYANPIKKVIRKFREWFMAIKLERRYTKEEIITMYFNKFDFLNLAVGIKSAAKVYFSTSPDSIKIEQAAMLVGMCKNPSLYNPIRRPQQTLERRNVVLGQMLKYGYIKKSEYDSLSKLPLKIKFQKVDQKEGLATYFREYLRQIMTAKEPNTNDYIDKQRYYEDSLDWQTNPLYGWCNKNLKPNGSPYDIYKDGLKIYCTIDSRMQRYAEEAVKYHLSTELQPKFLKEQKGRKKAPFAWNVTDEEINNIMKLSVKRTDHYRVLKNAGFSENEIMNVFKTPVPMTVFSWHGDKDTVLSPYDSLRYYKFFLWSSLMSMEPNTGYVRAYVGGLDYRYFNFDMVKFGKRQVGSTFKPFLYTLAMQEGYSPCYEVPNIPVSFDLPDGTTWSPKNSGETKRDGQMVTLRWALANSINFISAWLIKRYNPYAVINIARKMGVRSHIDPVPAICLGVPEISLYEMVAAFSTFADHGVYTQPIFVTRITDANGNVLGTFKPQRNEAISEQTAYMMIELLRGVVNQGTSWRLKGKYNILNDVAAKTGTTQNQSDGWYIGLVPKLVTGVWVGGEDRSIHFNSLEMGQGASMALPIWAYYMKKVYANPSLGYSDKDVFDKPVNIKQDMDCNKYKPYEEPGNDYEIIESMPQ
jgi:penicillin-binding protein 1A